MSLAGTCSTGFPGFLFGETFLSTVIFQVMDLQHLCCHSGYRSNWGNSCGMPGENKKKKILCCSFSSGNLPHKNSRFWSNEKWFKMRSGVMRTEPTDQSLQLKKFRFQQNLQTDFFEYVFQPAADCNLGKLLINSFSEAETYIL